MHDKRYSGSDLPENRAGRSRGAIGRLLWRWLPPLVWMGLIYFFSAQPDLPSAPGPWLDTVIKKSGHALSYGVLTCLYRRALRPHIRDSRMLRMVCVGLGVAYALSDEYHQSFVPGRNGTLLDVLIDSIGASGAMLLDQWLANRRARSRPVSAAR
jgi:VanZ family protein